MGGGCSKEGGTLEPGPRKGDGCHEVTKLGELPSFLPAVPLASTIRYKGPCFGSVALTPVSDDELAVAIAI